MHVVPATQNVFSSIWTNVADILGSENELANVSQVFVSFMKT